MDVAHFAAADHHASAAVVANVGANDVRLMQVDVVQVHSHSSVVINMAGRNQHVPVPLHQPYSMPQFTQQRALDGDLHRATGFDAVRFGMAADNLQTADPRHSLHLPDVVFE
jgi:hypothetical protein